MPPAGTVATEPRNSFLDGKLDGATDGTPAPVNGSKESASSESNSDSERGNDVDANPS
jgi:hypothetical protein